MTRVLIVGAGIIGAAIAERLASSGNDVVVVDASAPGGGATGASFGWINASFYADPTHFRLRAEGIAAWHRLSERLGLRDLTWGGAICWDGDLDAQSEALTALGYEVEELDRSALTALEPALRDPPTRALRFGLEGAAEPRAVTEALLAAATAAGARLVLGQRVRSLLQDEARVVGLETEAGLILADHVILAAGTDVPALLAPLGLALPMRDSPGDMLVTEPVPPCLSHVLVTPEREIRQDAQGRFWLPSTPGHQAVTGQREPFNIAALEHESLDVLTSVLDIPTPGVARLLRAGRPVPEDGLPVMGASGVEGLSLAVMHSGVTLAALVGELMAEVWSGETPPLLAPYSLKRFQGGSGPF